MLTKKTRNNDSELYFKQSTRRNSRRAAFAEIYRKRWGIETAFQRLEAHFNSEINSLGYPKAALFGFCLALVAFNIYAVIMASLRAAYPKVNIKEEVSEYYIAEDISTVYEGMIISVDDDEWNRFRHLGDSEMIVLLIYLAKQVNLKKFKKNKRGVKKEKPPIKFDKKTPHVSTLNIFKSCLNHLEKGYEQLAKQREEAYFGTVISFRKPPMLESAMLQSPQVIKTRRMTTLNDLSAPEMLAAELVGTVEGQNDKGKNGADRSGQRGWLQPDCGVKVGPVAFAEARCRIESTAAALQRWRFGKEMSGAAGRGRCPFQPSCRLRRIVEARYWRR
ncbi:MAG: transposase [Candidatus Competibacteraceae bacterium]|nr:transposase [Candidatus Competibacteraceae bacterium]